MYAVFATSMCSTTGLDHLCLPLTHRSRRRKNKSNAIHDLRETFSSSWLYRVVPSCTELLYQVVSSCTSVETATIRIHALEYT
jgi:hypothetical protein